MELKPGYKQTEVGVIPEDWEVANIGDFSSIKTGPFGTVLRADEYSESDGVPLISVGEIGIGRIKVTKRTPLIPRKVVLRLPQYVLRTGDIVFGRKGAVERSALVTFDEDGWFLGSDGIRIRPTSLVHPPYLVAQFHSTATQAWLANNAIGTTMASLNQQILRCVCIPLPPLPEQKAIAEALSNMDRLLSGLDSLIAKKRDIKQATMQQLLTGKTRLPGFSGEWEVRRLANNASLKARIGWQGLTTAEYRTAGTHLLVTGTDFVAGKVNWSGCFYVDVERYTQDKHIQLQCKDVLVTKDGTIGKVAFVDVLPMDATLNSGVFVIRPKGNAFDPRFFYYILSSSIFDDFLTKLAAGSTISHLYQKDFVTFTYHAPESLPEQQAIAKVLTDLDAELEALEQRRDKTRELKQAMMQELLTGRTRLV